MVEVEIRESAIQGLGVFAREDVPSGTFIRSYDLLREVTASSPVDPARGESPEHCTVAGGRVFLVGPPDRHFNHSCDPNAFKRFREGAIDIVARRDIRAGSEITHDYLINTHGGSTWRCRCAAPRCRGTLPPSFFDLEKAIQIEYSPLLADWFVAAHPDRVAALRTEAMCDDVEA